MNTQASPEQAGWPPSPVLARILFGLLPLLAAIGPLLTVFRGLFAFRLACVFVIAYAVLFLLGRDRWRPADLWLGAVTVSIAVAGLLGFARITPESQDPYSEFLSITLGLTAALATRAWQRRVPAIYLAVTRGWIAAGLISCAVAAGEVVTGVHLPGYLESAAPAPAAAFGNPDALAVFLVMANVWVFPVRRAHGMIWRSGTWALVAATGPALFFTGARLAMVIWLLVVAWAVLVGIRASRSTMSGLGASLVPVGAAIAFVLMVPILQGYFSEISTTGSSGSVREQLTRQGLGFAMEERGLPTWPGSFESLMLERGDPDAVAGLVNAHNTWVELLVQYGTLSLLLFLGWLVMCVTTRSAAQTETAVAVVALLLLGIVDSSSLDDASTWMFVMTLAMASRVELGYADVVRAASPPPRRIEAP